MKHTIRAAPSGREGRPFRLSVRSSRRRGTGHGEAVNPSHFLRVWGRISFLEKQLPRKFAPRPAARISDEEILKKFTVSPTGCHEWSASVTRGGYGQIHRKRDKESWIVLAHRLRWETSNGPIPSWAVVMHACDNPRCINIDHLRLGTPKENSDDKWQKGRARGKDGRILARVPSGLTRAFQPHWRVRETHDCLGCGHSFEAVAAERKRGRGLFCSRSCAGKNRARPAAFSPPSRPQGVVD